MAKNRVVVNSRGIVDLNESKDCFLPGKDRDQLILYAKIGSLSPYLLKDHKPIIYEALNKYLTENHPNYLVSIYLEGYNFALVYNEYYWGDGENDVTFTLFFKKKTGKIVIYKEELGNFQKAMTIQATVMIQKKFQRDPYILD